MTAGNLVCGFLAIMTIINAISKGGIDNLEDSRILFERAIWFILTGCLFDVLDGRLARLGGQESPFGKEFDSIADISEIVTAMLRLFIMLSAEAKFGS